MKIKVGWRRGGGKAPNDVRNAREAEWQSKVVSRLARQIWFGRTIDARARQDGLSHQRMHRRRFTCHRRPTRAASLDCPYGKATRPRYFRSSPTVSALFPRAVLEIRTHRGASRTLGLMVCFSLLLIAMGSLSAQGLDWVHSCCTAGRKVAKDDPNNSGKSERHQYDPNIRREGDVQKI
jgi:hypothetical protein